MKGLGGLRATSKKTGEVSGDGRSVSVETIRMGLKGARQWSPETKERLARGWGVGVDEVAWPGEMPDVEETRRRSKAGEYEGDIRPNRRFTKEEFAEAMRRVEEKQRRIAELQRQVSELQGEVSEDIGTLRGAMQQV